MHFDHMNANSSAIICLVMAQDKRIWALKITTQSVYPIQ